MAIPAIPAQGAPWLSYAQGLDDEIRTGRLSDPALRAALGLSVVATVSADAALAVGKFTPVDATAAARTMTLPTGAADGVTIGVEKVDASANAVSVTGSIRGVGSTTITLPWQHETLLLRADSTGSWWPVAGHKTKAALDAAYVPAVGSGRTPLITTMTAPSNAAGTQDFSTHTLRSYFTGDFTGVSSTNPGQTWGLNVFTATGPAANDGKGISFLTGALIEASVQSNATTIGTVIGAQAEAAFLGATSNGGHATTMISHKVSAPKRKDGATTATADYVYGLWIDDASTTGLGTTENWSWYCPGGAAYHGGNLTLGGNLNLATAKHLGIGSAQLATDGSGNLTTPGSVVSTAASIGFYAGTGGFWGNSLNYASDGSRQILWCTGTPEGAVSAGVGSIALRLDGGAGSTLYVKQSGSGNTGWIAK